MVEILSPTEVDVPLVPQVHSAKVTYLNPQDEEIDISADVVAIPQCSRKQLKDGLGAFEVVLNNFEGKYNDILVNGVVIKIYLDHVESDPQNQVFRGKIDDPYKSRTESNVPLLNIIGRDWPEVADDEIDENFEEETQADNALRQIINNNFSAVLTHTGIDTSMTAKIRAKYVDEKGYDSFADILKKVEFTGYIGVDGNVTTFPDGQNINNNEKIIYGVNLMPYSGFGKNNLERINKLRVYGIKKDDLLLVTTKEDTSLQQSSWVKSAHMTESTSDSVALLSLRAQQEFNYRKQLIDKAVLVAVYGLPTLQPGQSIECRDQEQGIEGYYIVAELNHILTEEGIWYTVCIISRTTKTEGKEILELQKDLAQTNENINGMDETVFYYDFEDQTDISNLGELRIENKKLFISTGSQGILSSLTRTVSKQPRFFEFKLKGTHLDVSYIRFSSDGGVTFNDDNRQYLLENYKDQLVEVTDEGKRVFMEIVLRSDTTYTNPQLERFEISVKY